MRLGRVADLDSIAGRARVQYQRVIGSVGPTGRTGANGYCLRDVAARIPHMNSRSFSSAANRAYVNNTGISGTNVDSAVRCRCPRTSI